MQSTGRNIRLLFNPEYLGGSRNVASPPVIKTLCVEFWLSVVEKAEYAVLKGEM